MFNQKAAHDTYSATIMATLTANVIKVSEFNNARDIKLSLDSKFTTLREGVETEVDSLNFKNVELQVQLKSLNKLMRLVEIKCMGHRAKPEIFKMLLEGSKVEFELILHKAEETIRANGEQATFDYNEVVLKNVEFPTLEKEIAELLVQEIQSPKLEKPELNSNDLLSLLYNK